MSSVKNFLNNILNGFLDTLTGFVWVLIKICICVYRFFKYVWYGLIWPIMLFAVIFSKYKIKKSVSNVEKLKIKGQKIADKDKKKAAKISKAKKENQDPMFPKVDLSSYKNEDIKLQKKSLGDLINTGLTAVISIPMGIKKKIENLALVKQARNKKAFDVQSLLVDFSDEENDQYKGKLITWQYVAIDEKGKKRTGTFDAYSKVDVQSFLMGEGLAVYSIKTSKFIQAMAKYNNKNRRIKNKDLIFMLAQLSTYLKAGIPLVESLNILIRQTKKKPIIKVLREVTYDLTVGVEFSTALEKRGDAFSKLLINMIRASELTGELPEALDDMVNYYTEAEAARKEMISALTYPTIVFLFTLGVVTFVMMYVVPKFVDIYNSMDSSEIPRFTLLVISISEFLEKNVFYLAGGIILGIFIILYLYKNVKIIRTMMQWIFMHIPVLKDVIIYNEVTMFSKTFASLLAHNVHITDSMEILNRITNNEIYKMMILDTVANLARGDKISAAFKDQWAFPISAYQMIVTGEKTGQLAEMMAKVSSYYQSLHKNTVSRIKSLVEPILIVFLTLSVGAVLLAVIIPMFNMYQQVQNLG